jgi:succinoglycan biosynthesis transport protein ExoP
MTQQIEGEGLRIYPRELMAMLYRRWHWLILPMILGAAIAGAMIVLSKPVYRSAATMLIESPQIPTSLVASHLTDVADERIAKIRQQIVSSDNLSEMIERNGLFPAETAELDRPAVVDLMRGGIGVDLVHSNQEENGGATIAFTISFAYSDPRKAQEVTEQLTTMFVAEDKRFRTEQAMGTAAFLERRSDELLRQLRALEDERREVESRYAGALPGNVALSAQSNSSNRAEISRMDAETQGLLQQNSLLAVRQNEMEQAPPEGMEGLIRARDRLAQLEARFSENFPDVVAARNELRRQEELMRQQPAGGQGNLLQMEIAAGRERIETLAARRAQLVQSVAELDHRVAQAPQATYEINMIEREYDNIKRQYDSLREMELEAQVAANLQSEDKGERFTIVDPPSLPTEPIGPKPVVLMTVGLAGGVFLVLASGFLSGTVHGVQTLTHILGVPNFGVVPVTRENRFALLVERFWPLRPRRFAASNGGDGP